MPPPTVGVEFPKIVLLATSQGAVAVDAGRTSTDIALRNAQCAQSQDAVRSVGDGQVGDRCTGAAVDRQHDHGVIAADREPAGPGAVDGNGIRYRQRTGESNGRAGRQRKNDRVAIVCIRQRIAQGTRPVVGVTGDRDIGRPCERSADRHSEMTRTKTAMLRMDPLAIRGWQGAASDLSACGSRKLQSTCRRVSVELEVAVTNERRAHRARCRSDGNMEFPLRSQALLAVPARLPLN